MKTYGIISDVHADPRIAEVAIGVLKHLGAERLILNGDIGEMQPSLEASQAYIATILESAAKSNLQTYVQPGSHETVGFYLPVVEFFSEKFSNITNVLEEQVHDELIFLPGSDFVTTGEFRLGNEIPTGLYIPTENGVVPYDQELHQQFLENGMFNGLVYFSNIEDVKPKVKDPEKSLVVCHVPRKFDKLEGAVDKAYFAESDRGILPGVIVETMIRNQYGDVNYVDLRIIAASNGFSLKEENRGNEELRDLFNELGLRKAVNGHFHESGHNAHDGNVVKVNENEFVDELYWNSGQLDTGHCGLIRVNDGKVAYQNVKLQDYLR
ncbi:hypothetical protein D6777_04035 [Candidatus Woesearchaeota archaeon]|nr:MAG: hypothetical protein D6777_04035 [Candidatus Woesearchaeota archaeon]